MFGDWGEFNSMRTGELKMLGLGGYCFLGEEGKGNFFPGKGSVHHYMP